MPLIYKFYILKYKNLIGLETLVVYTLKHDMHTNVTYLLGEYCCKTET